MKFHLAKLLLYHSIGRREREWNKTKIIMAKRNECRMKSVEILICWMNVTNEIASERLHVVQAVNSFEQERNCNQIVSLIFNFDKCFNSFKANEMHRHAFYIIQSMNLFFFFSFFFCFHFGCDRDREFHLSISFGFCGRFERCELKFRKKIVIIEKNKLKMECFFGCFFFVGRMRYQRNKLN